MGRSAAVGDQLLAYCQEAAVDVTLLQEPYTNRGKLSGFEVHPFRSFLRKPVSRPGQSQNVDIGAEIVVFNPALRVFYPSQGLENFVTIVLDNGQQNSVTLISGSETGATGRRRKLLGLHYGPSPAEPSTTAGEIRQTGEVCLHGGGNRSYYVAKGRILSRRKPLVEWLCLRTGLTFLAQKL